MKYIDRLLQGAPVEWRPLGEVAEIKTGSAVSKKLIAENPGIYPVINSGKDPLGFIDSWNTENDPLGITSRGAGVGSVTWQEGRYFRGNLNYSVTIRSLSVVSIRFLYYVLLNVQKEIQSLCTFQGIPALNASNLKKLEIPIPPVAVQEEVVRILDKFTALEAELEVALSTELDCRKRQYRYYRDALLTFDLSPSDGLCHSPLFSAPFAVEWRSLGEVAKIKNGKDYKHLSPGEIPVYGSGGIMTYIDDFSYDQPSVLIPRKGSLNNLFYVDTPFWNVDTIFYTSINSEMIVPKFFYYYLSILHLERLNLAGGVPSLTQKVLNKIEIPVPPVSVQERIVEILDKFDTLVNSISEGLPREIELRRKQYEYYRDALLSF